MKKIGIFYGSTTGNTETVARQIAADLNVADQDIYDVSKTAPSAVGPYDVILMGCSTWGDGDMQEDMHDFIDGLSAVDLSGKMGALFGCGDESMTETFCNAVGEMYDKLSKTGLKYIGQFNSDGFEYDHSEAVRNGHAVGLMIDNVNHPELTDAKISSWTDEIRQQIS